RLWRASRCATPRRLLVHPHRVPISTVELAAWRDDLPHLPLPLRAADRLHPFPTNLHRSRRCRMNELIWLNGEIIPMSQARISPEDRGFQFADGVYEVIRLYAGRPFTLNEHLARLENSAAELKLTIPIETAKLKSEITRLIEQSGAGEGMIYLQLTRGHAPRNHLFPRAQTHTLLFYPRPLDALPAVE